MGKTIGIDMFADAVAEILDDYGDAAYESLVKESDKVARTAAKELRATSPKHEGGKHAGRYAKGWTTTKESGRVQVKNTVHNRTDYQLTHLLEKGHALRQGGRSPAKPHIAAAEAKAVEEFQRRVIRDLGG